MRNRRSIPLQAGALPGKGEKEEQTFLADAMLGSLARKLRIFGYDTAYFREGSDLELQRTARREGRVILTSDRGLLEVARRRRLRALLIEGKDDRARILSLAAQARSLSLAGPGDGSRCAVCNGELERVGKEEAAPRLPPGSAKRHRLYYVCRGCGKLYWRGKHWRRLRRLSRLITSEGFNQ